MNKRFDKGISIIEVMVVMLLVMVTAIMWSMNRKSQLRVAYQQEARIFIQDIVNRERMYFAQNSQYLEILVPTSTITLFNISALKNNYFKTFSVEVDTAAPYSEINPRLEVIAYGANKAAGITVSGIYQRENDDLVLEEIIN